MIIQVCKVSIKQPKPQRMPPEDEKKFWVQFGTSLRKALSKLIDESSAYDEPGKGIGYEAATNWGKMQTLRMKMTKTERHHSFRHRYSYVGPFRYAHRALLPISDGRAWHHKVSGKGGTLLIDCSGSMGISVEDILQVLKTNPLATVAIYHGNATAKEGYLKILASNNRYCTGFYLEGSGNVVDGPALKWLAHQERPRIWICDGDVTGVDDKIANPAMLIEVARTVKRSDIKWALSLGDPRMTQWLGKH